MTTYDASWQTPQPPRTGSVSYALVVRSYKLVTADPTMLGVVAVGAVASGAAFSAIAVPAWLWTHTGWSTAVPNLRSYLAIFVGGWASAFVSLVFSGAVVAAGVARLDGQPITARQALKVAAGRWRQLAAWAFTTMLVSTFESLLRRLGLAGAILGLVTEVAWALATMLALPVIVVEGKMPVAAVRESVDLVKGRLGLTVRAKIRLNIPWMLLAFFGFVVATAGLVIFFVYRHDTPSWAAAGLILAVVGALMFFGAGSVANAADAYLNTLLYRHALGLPVPDADPRDLPGLGSPAGGPGSP